MLKFTQLMVGAILLFTCQTYEAQVTRKQRAMKYLNEGQYESAISELSVQLEEDNSDETRLLLASAYVGSVGLNIIESFEFFNGLLMDMKGMGSAGANPIASSESELEAKVRRFLLESSRIVSVIFKLPHLIEATNRNRINEALYLLSQIQPGSELYPKAQTYKAFLSMFQFLNYFRLALPDLPDASNPTSIDVLCQLHGPTFVDNLDLSLGYIIGSIEAAQISWQYRGKEFPGHLIKVKQQAEALLIQAQQKAIAAQALYNVLNRIQNSGICH